MLGLRHQPAKEAALSPTALTKVRDALARALSVDDVNQLGRDTGSAPYWRTPAAPIPIAIVASDGYAPDPPSRRFVT